MSRSIHTTRKTVKELRKKKFPTVEEKRAALKKARSALARKRKIKSLVKEERHRGQPPLTASSPETIPIEALHEGKFVHHGASVDDIRNILALLPDGATEGIARIQLALGKEYMEEWYDDDEERDPFTGRLSGEVLPGVYGGRALGTRWSDTGLISIYAYVYDPDHLPLPRKLCEFYLKLHALKTFVHEVAHHHDHTARVARGRWRADRHYTVEWYAEKMEHEWTLNVVLPYLKKTYPKETLALRKWVAHWGGLMPELEFFAGDERRTERSGLTRLVVTTSSSFESWIESLAACKSLVESRIEFAKSLHYADCYEDCLLILDDILAETPQSVSPLVWKADTLVHLERYGEALTITELVLRLDPANTHAWKTRSNVLVFTKNWHGLLSSCDSWEKCGPLKKMATRAIHTFRAVAYCALGDTEQMDKNFHAELALIQFTSEESAKRYKEAAIRRIYRRSGKDHAAQN